MSCRSLAGSSAIVLAALAAASSATAQVPPPELVIEGPIDEIGADYIKVMGIHILVPNKVADTPTKLGVPLESLNDSLPGRDKGFVGGTAIVTGGSTGGVVTATEVFSDVNENVVVGEVTSSNPLEVNGLPMLKSTSPVIPASPPMNVFGFQIDDTTVAVGSLISVEGYLSDDDGPKRLYYHTLEADTGEPLNRNSNEVSVTRTQCRDRNDANKDELEVQGWVHRAGLPNLTGTLPAITITYPALTTGRTPTKVTGSATIVPVVDPASPQYAQYRYRSSNRNLDGCPLRIKVSWQGDTDSAVSEVDTDATP
ncbi:hypothetical protein [Geminicoccus flavidas]|uniref:hypothetical protein n=1 Tax=Geminicoccus flavidas TaxID=2506407 RepID=UPI001357F128|nr:hypothetical protein [Geminicoccus flavidas]